MIEPKMNHPILIVEDSHEDYEATVRGFEKAGLANPIYHCEGGDEALDFLYHRGQYEDPKTSPRPGIILLDLNLPGTSGCDVLRTVKANDDLKSIPVVVLTTSSDERDVSACYEMGANSYVMKPISLDGFFQAIQRLKEWWFEIVILPK